MKKFTIELDEMICKWLEHISEVTGESVETLIANRPLAKLHFAS